MKLQGSRLVVPLWFVVGVIALGGCLPATNMLGRRVVIQHYDNQSSQGVDYFEAQAEHSIDQEPLVVFLEGDGGQCQEYSQRLWERFLTRYTGNYVLVRPVTAINKQCATPRWRSLDFFGRLEETERLIDVLQKRHSTRELVLLGHSAGAHLAMLYAEKHPKQVSAIVNLGGGMEELSIVLRAIEKTKYDKGEYNRKQYDRRIVELEEELNVVRQHSTDSSVFWGRTYCFWNQMFFSGVSGLWRTHRGPYLLIHGRDDHDSVPVELVLQSSKEVDAAVMGNKDFLFFDDMGHDLLNKQIMLRVNDWISKVVEQKNVAK